MKRRTLLKLGAGLALGASAGARATGRSSEQFLIVGGGIIGASICYQLARRGAQVTLLEKTRPAAGASGKSFAWINANYSKQPLHYHRISRLGVHAFHELQRQIGADLPVRWGGTLEWYADEARAQELRDLTRRQRQWGYPVQAVDAAGIVQREPHVIPGEVLAGAWSALEGSVDSAAATRVLLRHAQNAGARVVHPCEVRSIALRGTRSVTLGTSEGEFNASRVVLAAGVDTPALAALAGLKVPLTPSPGIVVRTTPQAPLANSVLVTIDSHFHQQTDGRFVLGDDNGPPASAVHRQLASAPSDFPDSTISQLHGQRIRAQAARYLAPLAQAAIESVSLCWRPMPADGFPIVGTAAQAPQLYVAVMHSGVTLGPLIGELAAMELLDAVEIDLLKPYRPARYNA